VPASFWSFVVFVYGAIVGSFLNVLIYRMPLGISVSRPPSHCPRCNHYLGFWDNIPLLSFLFLRARCRYCRTPISWRYFGVELLTGALWVLLYLRLSDDTGISWVSYVASALFASVLVAVIFIDLDHFLIPDELNWVGVALGVGRDVACMGLAWYAGNYYLADALKQFTHFGWLPRSVLGALVYGGFMFALSFVAFLYYAREEGEPLARTARRFLADEEEEAEEEAPETDRLPESSPVVSATGELAAIVATVPTEEAPAFVPIDEEETEEEDEPVRLRFSPAFLAAASALLLVPALQAWAVLAFVLPLSAFVAMSRRPGEPTGATVARFFQANDQQAGLLTSEPAVALPGGALTPGSGAAEEEEEAPAWTEDTTAAPDDGVAAPTAPTVAQLARESDEFAREAESGKHGGMGLGDVKLALAIGALLGWDMALLSLLFAAGAGSVVGIGLALAHGRGLRLGIPFGPFMAFGALVSLLYGPDLVAWYRNFSGLA